MAADGLPLEHAAGEAEAARRSNNCCTATAAATFPGVLALLEKEYATTASESKRQRLEALRGEVRLPRSARGPGCAPRPAPCASRAGRSTK